MEPMEEVIEPVKAPKPKRTAKKAAKSKKAKAKSKPKAKKAPKKKAVKSKTKKAGVVVRSERLDMRLSKPEKASIMAVCKKTSRTYTSVALEALRLGLPKVRAAR